MNSQKTIGNTFEAKAMDYLQQQGLHLINRNFHSRFGEIDLIMQDKDTLVFVEVKYRKNGLDEAAESITYSKQKKLIKTAEYYLLKQKTSDIPCRFDAILTDGNMQIKWLKNIILV